MNHAGYSHVNAAPRLLGGCLLLLSGLAVYWFFRPQIVLFQLLHIENPNPFPVDDGFTRILNNYFADAVWCLALVLVVSLLRDYRVPRAYRQALTALPFFSEIMQSAGVIPGVFDWVDMAIYFFITIPSINKEFRPMIKMEKNFTGGIAVTFFTLALLASSNATPPPAPAPEKKWVTGPFLLQPRENDVFTKTSLIKSLKLSTSPSIVLRVPNPGDKVTEEQRQKNSVLYNLIEKEFAKAGFVVRDRQLFAKVLEQETSDYSKIGVITETDFILELLSYNLSIKTEVKTYLDETGEQAEAPFAVKFNSAVAEFKLISVKKNDLVGAYTFYYTPCIDGCKERFDPDARSWSVNNSVPTDFFKTVAQELVREMGYLR